MQDIDEKMKFSDPVLQRAYDKKWFFEAQIFPFQVALNMRTFREWQRNNGFFYSIGKFVGENSTLGIAYFDAFRMSEEMIWEGIAATTVLDYVKRKISNVNESILLKQHPGHIAIRDEYLNQYLRKYAVTELSQDNVDEFLLQSWDSIRENNNSVQHLDFIPDRTKKVFLTPKEIDPSADDHYPDHPYKLKHWKEIA